MINAELIAAVEDRCKALTQPDTRRSIQAVADALGYIGLLAVANARRSPRFGWPAMGAVLGSVGMLVGLVCKLFS